jgi:hypothetical protein
MLDQPPDVSAVRLAPIVQLVQGPPRDGQPKPALRQIERIRDGRLVARLPGHASVGKSGHQPVAVDFDPKLERTPRVRWRVRVPDDVRRDLGNGRPEQVTPASRRRRRRQCVQRGPGPVQGSMDRRQGGRRGRLGDGLGVEYPAIRSQSGPPQPSRTAVGLCRASSVRGSSETGSSGARSGGRRRPAARP